MNKPYRLFYTSHWIGSTSEAVRDQNYYFLKPLATAANEPAIFVAPQSDGSTWQQKDHALFDDILAFVKQNLCIDTTRVFATGFSFGGMITYSLSVNHQKDIRAARGHRPGQLQHLPAHQDPRTHRMDANDGHGRRYVSMGQWEQHDPRREVHRHRARHRQRVHRAGHHTDLAVKATMSATTSRDARRSFPPRRARSTADIRTLPMTPAAT